ncbi:SIR2 family NAD-dependent protein deacylase [Corallococcus sp. M7]
MIPFLGAGFSAPLRLPLWKQLMGWMGADLGFAPELFEVHGHAPHLAGYFDLESPKRLEGFIREKMAPEFHAPAVEDRRKKSLQHQALARCRFRTIYTTNFEHHIEEALRDGGQKVQVLTRLEDFRRPAEPDTCQVIKFHGDLSHPDSIVLTERQFFDRFRLEAAPDQRLRSDLLGNVFLFLGYGFGDVNLRYIWYRMDLMLRESLPPGAVLPAEHHSYWAAFETGLVQPRLLQQWHIDVIQLDSGDKSGSVVALLDALQA